MTALVVGLVLLCLDKLPLLDDPVTSLKRIIVITMPASMGAIVVDSFDKEWAKRFKNISIETRTSSIQARLQYREFNLDLQFEGGEWGMHIHKEEDQAGNQRKHTWYKNKCDDHDRLNIHQHNKEENDDQRGR